eukprot:1043727-Rhodomonas_salina.1
MLGSGEEAVMLFTYNANPETPFPPDPRKELTALQVERDRTRPRALFCTASLQASRHKSWLPVTLQAIARRHFPSRAGVDLREGAQGQKIDILDMRPDGSAPTPVASSALALRCAGLTRGVRGAGGAWCASPQGASSPRPPTLALRLRRASSCPGPCAADGWC